MNSHLPLETSGPFQTVGLPHLSVSGNMSPPSGNPSTFPLNWLQTPQSASQYTSVPDYSLVFAEMSFLMDWKLHKEGNNDPWVILVPTLYSSEFRDLSTATSNCENSMDLIQRTFPTEAAIFVAVLQSLEPIAHMCNVEPAWATIETEKFHGIASANGRPKETKAKFSPNPEALGPAQIRKPPSKTRKREMKREVWAPEVRQKEKEGSCLHAVQALEGLEDARPHMDTLCFKAQESDANLIGKYLHRHIWGCGIGLIILLKTPPHTDKRHVCKEAWRLCLSCPLPSFPCLEYKLIAFLSQSKLMQRVLSIMAFISDFFRSFWCKVLPLLKSLGMHQEVLNQEAERLHTMDS